MTCTIKGIVRRLPGAILSTLVLTMLQAGALSAEPLLLVYPSSPAIFRYDPARYEPLAPSHPDFNLAYSVGGVVLWDKEEQRIPIEVYRAPAIVSIEPSGNGVNEFETLHNDFQVIVDGFAAYPRTLSNLHVRFLATPPHSTPQIHMDGSLVLQSVYPVGALNVTTPVDEGFYADTMELHLTWSGAAALRIVVFSDKNYNGVYDDGKPQWSIVARDNTVPVSQRTWGAIKSLYKD